jgi:hypothetical protein
MGPVFLHMHRHRSVFLLHSSFSTAQPASHPEASGRLRILEYLLAMLTRVLAQANARELKERLKTLEDEEAAQQVVRKKIRELVREPRTRVFYLKSAVQQLLSEAHMAGLNNSCEEVRAGLELLHWCTEHGKH